MKVLSYKCTLLTDVILNSKSASVGTNETLDFIPGSNFLGIVASNYDSLSNEVAWEIFHSGKVRFGDAHPSSGKARSLRVPASFFYAKGNENGDYYVHHVAFPAGSFEGFQPKQCRNGFYDFSNNKATKVDTFKSFAIKSAHDKFTRKSEDGKMFGYESLCEGLELIFQIEVDNDSLAQTIDKLIRGTKRIGRSRTAQYGLVKIEECIPETIGSRNKSGIEGIVTVYADGRLIFIDENGLCTFRPTPEQLGFPNGKIRWDLSQVRTFQYAPWNYKRRCFDTDRCGIEKGSVFVIETKEDAPASTYVGCYNNEGFGKVIYNSGILDCDQKGKSLYGLSDSVPKHKSDLVERPLSAIIDYAESKQKELAKIAEIYSAVSEWVKLNRNRFADDKFPSQWGAIRSIASSVESDFVFGEVEHFISNGESSKKWIVKDRKRALLDFMEKFEKDPYYLALAVVNLASVMAKEKMK